MVVAASSSSWAPALPSRFGVAGQVIELGQNLAGLFGHALFGFPDPRHLIGRRTTCSRHGLHPVFYIRLLSAQLSCPLLSVGQVPFDPVVLYAFQLVSGVSQSAQRGLGVRGCTAPTVGRRLAHLVGASLELARNLLQLGVTGLPRETLQLPGRLFRFFGQVAGRLAPTAALTAALLGCRTPSLPLQFLLLSARQFPQLLEGFIHLFVRRLLFAALNRLVLVAQLIEFQLEQVGQILSVGRVPALSAPATLLGLGRHEALVRLFSVLECAKG